jgi:hypothetical protein
MNDKLAHQLSIAILLLKNYAAFDERHGYEEDADYTRRRIAKMDEVLAEFEVVS